MDKLNVSDLPMARRAGHSEQSQPDQADKQDKQPSFSGMRTRIFMPGQAQTPPLSSLYPQTQLADLRVAQHDPTDEPQSDPFQALLSHRTTSFDEHSSYEDDNEAYISVLPTTDEGKPKIRTTVSIAKFAIDPSIERHFEHALLAFQKRSHPTISSTTASKTTTVAAINVAEDACVVESSVTTDTAKSRRRTQKTTEQLTPIPMATVLSSIADEKPRSLSGHPLSSPEPDPTYRWIRNTSSKDTQYMCAYPNCGNTYTKSSSLKAPIFSHSNVSRYICRLGECNGRHFRDRCGFTRHIRTKHTLDKPFACNLCDIRFGRKDSLQKHKTRIHCGQQEPLPKAE